MFRITKELHFYKLMLSIALPIAIQNLITFAVSMIDTLMLGSLGEVELSAAAISNNLFFIFMILIFGLVGGSNIMISQYWGKEDTNSIYKILAIMYRVCIGMSLIFISIAALLPRQFLAIFTTDQAVINAGESYLRVVCIGYLFYALTNCTIMMLRSVKTVKISILVYSISLCVNGFFNWIFIFGNLGAPKLGVTGAAIGTVLARLAEFTVMLIFMIFFEKKLQIRLKHLIKVDKAMAKDYFKTCTPVVFNELLWTIGCSMIAVIVGRLGTEVVAANSINSVTNQFVTVFIFGMSNATAVIIGNTIGQGKYEKAKEYACTVTLLMIVLGVCAGALTYMLRPFVISLYNVSDVTKGIAMDIMTVTSIIVCFQALASTTMIGILRGGGDVKFVLINDVIFMWMIAIPFGFLAAFLWKLPIVCVFFIMRSDEILKVIMSITRIISGKWVKDVTRKEEGIIS